MSPKYNSNFEDDFIVLGARQPAEAAKILRELGEETLADRLAAADSSRVRGAGAFATGLPIWPFQDRAWQHTAHAFGFITLDDSSTSLKPIKFAGAIQPDQSLKSTPIKITLDRLRVADYPGGGTHNILFDFYARNQVQDAEEHLHFNVYLRALEGQEAAVIGHPIFVGLNVGSEGLALRCRTINVRNDADENMLSFLESDTFRSGLRLFSTAQPALIPFSEMAVGIASGILKRNRNVPVQDFFLGLDFSKVVTGARLAQGSYIIIQIPDRLQRIWDWNDWQYDPLTGSIVNLRDANRILPYNYIVLGLTKLQDDQRIDD